MKKIDYYFYIFLWEKAFNFSRESEGEMTNVPFSQLTTLCTSIFISCLSYTQKLICSSLEVHYVFTVKRGGEEV